MTLQHVHSPRTHRPARGFTLIEMMAALTLIGMIAGLMLPNFQRWYDSTQQRVNAGAIGIQLQKLYVRAALLGQDFELTPQSAGRQLADGELALLLPAGWKIADQQRLNVRASGYCAPASIEFQGPDARLRFAIMAPQCSVIHQVVGSGVS